MAEKPTDWSDHAAVSAWVEETRGEQTPAAWAGVVLDREFWEQRREWVSAEAVSIAHAELDEYQRRQEVAREARAEMSRSVHRERAELAARVRQGNLGVPKCSPCPVERFVWNALRKLERLIEKEVAPSRWSAGTPDFEGRNYDRATLGGCGWGMIACEGMGIKIGSKGWRAKGPLPSLDVYDRSPVIFHG